MEKRRERIRVRQVAFRNDVNPRQCVVFHLKVVRDFRLVPQTARERHGTVRNDVDQQHGAEIVDKPRHEHLFRGFGVPDPRDLVRRLGRRHGMAPQRLQRLAHRGFRRAVQAAVGDGLDRPHDLLQAQPGAGLIETRDLLRSPERHAVGQPQHLRCNHRVLVDRMRDVRHRRQGIVRKRHHALAHFRKQGQIIGGLAQPPQDFRGNRAGRKHFADIRLGLQAIRPHPVRAVPQQRDIQTFRTREQVDVPRCSCRPSYSNRRLAIRAHAHGCPPVCRCTPPSGERRSYLRALTPHDLLVRIILPVKTNQCQWARARWTRWTALPQWPAGAALPGVSQRGRTGLPRSCS